MSTAASHQTGAEQVTPPLANPAFWARDDCHRHIRAARQLASVHVHTSPDGGEIASVLSYAVARRVLGDVSTFSSERGSLLGFGPEGPAGVGKMMALTDPPAHTVVRGSAARFFTRRGVRALHQRIVAIADEVVDEALERRDVEVVEHLARRLPLEVMCEIMGVPRREQPEVIELTDRAFLSPGAPARAEAHRDLLALLFDIAVAAQGKPLTNVIAALANRTEAGQPVLPEDIIFNCDNLLVGGVQTVRHTIAMSLHALAGHPESYRAFPQAPGRDLDLAVEELLRFTSVALHALRTARKETMLGEHPIRKGDRVVVWLPAANRDESIFVMPDRLDLTRTPNPHIAFGHGPHYCIGARLARLEIQALMMRLRRRVRVLVPLEPPEFNQSLINFGPAKLELRLLE